MLERISSTPHPTAAENPANSRANSRQAILVDAYPRLRLGHSTHELDGRCDRVPAGTVSLKSDPAGEWAVQTVRSDAQEGGIRVRTITDLVSGEGPSAQLFIVKVDIEGFEQDRFHTILGWIDDTTAIIVELHDWMHCGKRTSANLQRAIAQREFELTGRTSSTYG